MRKLILSLLFLGYGLFAQGQTAPVAPIQLTTNSAYLEPSTGRHWFFNGATYQWWQALGVKDSTLYVTHSYGDSHYAPSTGGAYKLKSDSTGADGYLRRGSLYPLGDLRYAPITGGGYAPNTPPYGTIYNNSNFTSLTDFVNNGATASVSSGKLLINGVGADYTHSLDYNYNSMLPNWTMAARLIVPTVTSTSVMAIGLRSTNATNPHSLALALDLSNRGTAGRLLFLYGATLSTSIISTSNLTFAAGDTLEVVISRNDFIHWTARVVNKTSPNTADISAVYNNETATTGIGQAENTGRFSIFANCVDVVTYLSLKITSAVPTHADWAMVSDSKWAGAGATTYMQSMIGSLSYYNNIAHLSGGGDGTDAIISRLPEIIALAPKVVFLDIGRNDLALYGLSLSTVMANIATIYNTLTAAGIRVWLFNGEWETVYPTGTLAAAITAAYPNNSIDTYSVTKAGGAAALASDGIHLSDYGQDLLSIFFRTQNKANVKTYTVGTNSSIYNPNIYGPLQTWGGLLNLSHPTANVVAFRNAGAAIPSFITRSLGTKISFYANTLGGSSGEYAMGIATSTLWTSIPTSTQRLEWYAGVGVIGTLTGTGNFSVPGTIASGTAGTSLGSYLLSGNTSGTVSIKPQAVAGTYNFNLPITAGASGQFLTSGGGVAAPMTWTTPVGFANPMTTAGDIIYGGASGVATRLATGTGVLHSGATPSWSTIATADIANNAVTFGKMQAITANRLLGSGLSGTAVAEITLGTGLSFTGTVLNATGGTVSSVSSANTDIGVATGTSTAVLTFNRAGTYVWSGTHDFNAAVGINSQITFTGSSAINIAKARSLQLNNTGGTFNTILAWDNATATRTITFPDANGPVILGGSSPTFGTVTSTYATLSGALGSTNLGNATAHLQTTNFDGSQNTLTGWRYIVGANEVKLWYYPTDSGGAGGGASRLEVFNTGITAGQTVNGGQSLAYLSDLSGGYIPYTGATTDVNLGAHFIQVDGGGVSNTKIANATITQATGQFTLATGNASGTTFTNTTGPLIFAGTSHIFNAATAINAVLTINGASEGIKVNQPTGTANYAGASFVNNLTHWAEMGSTGSTSASTPGADMAFFNGHGTAGTIIMADGGPVWFSAGGGLSTAQLKLNNNGTLNGAANYSSLLMDLSYAQKIYVDGASIKPIRSIASATTILPADYTVYVSSGTFNQPLPTTTLATGQIINLANNGPGTVTVTGTNIGGQTSIILSPGSTLTVQFTGTSGTYIIL